MKTQHKQKITRCRECSKAHLVQYGTNPIIAECEKGNFVANWGNPRCESGTPRTTPEVIEHRVNKTQWAK